MLRYKSVPAGFCYQKLILDDETAPVLAYHGLNAVYIKDVQRWIRIDAGVKAPFSAEPEQLVLKLRPEKGEKDGLIVYPDPAGRPSINVKVNAMPKSCLRNRDEI